MMMTAKPYKKRLLSSINVTTVMEVDSSDGTERNQTTSPSSQEESEKDNSKEYTRPRKGWKKKICRKQFRHHDIEIFKPGTNPTTCLLKKKESSPTIIKKFEVPPSQNELITDSIVNTLGGQKSPPPNHTGVASLPNHTEINRSASFTDSIVNTLGGQKSPPPNHIGVASLPNHTEINRSASFTENSIRKKNNNKSENNTNQETHNINRRHHLPAIVNEIPNIRRNSIDVGYGTINGRAVDEKSKKPAKNSWPRPNLLPGARRSSIDMPLLTESKSVEILSYSKEDTVVKSKHRKETNDEKAIISENSVKRSQTEHMESKTNKIYVTENTARVLEPIRNNLSIPECNIQSPKPILQKIYYEMPVNSCRVHDLSLKSQTKIEECSRITKRRISEVPVDLSIKSARDLSIKNAENLSTMSEERFFPKISRQYLYHDEKLSEQQWLTPPTHVTHVLPGSTFHAANLREVVQSSNLTNFRKVEEEINFHIAKINSILHKDFSINNLRRLSQSYHHLTEILNICHTLRLENKAYIENILNNTFRYISDKLKHANLEPIAVLKILGTPEPTQEKADMMGYLNKIFHLAANIPVQTISNNVYQRHKVVKSLRISPKEKGPKIKYQKKIEQLKQHLPPYNTLPPNLMSSVTIATHSSSLPAEYPTQLQIDKRSVPSWRYIPEILTPSPTSPNITFRPPPHETNLQQRRHVDQRPSLRNEHDSPQQSPNRPNSLPNMNNLELNESTDYLPHRPEILRSPVIIKEHREKDSTEARRYLDDKNRVKTIRLGSVIVADTSMQITKECVQNLTKNGSHTDSSKNNKDKFSKEPQRMNIDPLSETGKNKTEIEFLNIIQKLKTEFPEEKMTELLLSQLQGTNKERKIVVEDTEPIEITDSDSEDSRKEVPLINILMNQIKDVRKMKPNIEKRRPENLEITTKTKLDIHTKIRLENNISKNYTPTSVQCTVQKTVYSPEIEPISPVEEEAFQFPDLTENNINPKYTVTSNQSNTSDDKKESYKTDLSKTKRQKSEEANGLARLAPHGKLCYIREHNIFLRYFDESQAKLFIENSVSRGDESTKDKTILNKNTPPSEKILIPPQVEFSHKEDIPEPIEFVHELRLVEQFVPKDFAAFYRFVTGYQIVRNKNPVSLQTFLLMYNTNGITELLNKYLNTTEGDQMVPI